jgi:thiol-disulfide isomerase/thioredoxin
MRVILIMVGLAAVAGFLAYTLFRGPQDGGAAVGEPAPDFTAQTLDGQTIRLSDLRGKVVVLDFWATWCGPCVAMIPHERELVSKHAGKPFVFVGISADKDAQALRAFVRDKSMDWPQVHDGPGGPLQRLYQIEYYPSIYVLDGQGVVRYRDVRGQELDRAVETLLASVAK